MRRTALHPALAAAAVTTAVFTIGAIPARGGEPIVFETIALDGDPAFDDPAETLFLLGVPVINNQGLVAFEARTTGEIGGLEAVFSWQAGVGRMIAREGQPLAQHPTATYDRVGRPRIDEAGRFMFFADYSSTNVSGAVVAGFRGELRIIAWSGRDPNPDPDYAQRENIGPLGTLLLSRQGGTALDWGQTGPREVWVGDTSAIELVAFPFMPAPAYPPGSTMCCYGLTRYSGTERAVTRATISGITGGAILLAGPDGTSIPVGTTLPTPGVAGTFTFLSTLVSTNSAGHLGIRSLYDDDASGESRQGLWVGPPDALQPIALENMPAPGFPGQSWTGFYGPPILTPSGHGVFGAYTTEDTTGIRKKIWRWDGSESELLFESGDPILNVDGATFFYIPGDSITVNDHDQVAFRARVILPGGDVTTSLLVTDLAGGLYAIATEGQSFEVAPGDVRTVEFAGILATGTSGPLTGVNGDDGFGSSFNDTGQLAILLSFDDQTRGIFIASLVPAPPCPWDLNGDGVVNVLDLIELVMSFGPCEGCPADINDDGFVNVLDLIALIMNFGPCPGTPCVWDVNGDGVVDQSDLQAVTSNLGPCDGCPEDVNGDGVVNGQDAAAVATHFGPCP